MNSQCPQCHALVDPVAGTCPSCAADLHPPRKAALHVDRDDDDTERASSDLLSAVVAGTTEDRAAHPPAPLVTTAATAQPTPPATAAPPVATDEAEIGDVLPQARPKRWRRR